MAPAVSRKDVAAIPLGHPLPDASVRPTRTTGPETGWRVAPPRCPYSVLLPMGFTVPLPLPARAVGSYPTVSPLPRQAAAVSFLWHFPSGPAVARLPGRTLSGIVFPWSPDFPPTQPFGERVSGHPAGWRLHLGMRAVRVKESGAPAAARRNFGAFGCMVNR